VHANSAVAQKQAGLGMGLDSAGSGRKCVRGNIVITGHDDEVHAGGCGYATQASDQLRAMVTFARSGAPNSLLPVLSFDHGEKLKACLTATDIFIFHRSSPAP
jgi:hypothetical protein